MRSSCALCAGEGVEGWLSHVVFGWCFLNNGELDFRRNAQEHGREPCDAPSRHISPPLHLRTRKTQGRVEVLPLHDGRMVAANMLRV